MIIYIDIDETICVSPENRNYAEAAPILENITKANRLYDDGHTIVYWTARGSGSGIDWREVTEKQFDEWGVKCHELRLGKPIYDLFIDDKNMNVRDWPRQYPLTITIVNCLTRYEEGFFRLWVS